MVNKKAAKNYAKGKARMSPKAKEKAKKAKSSQRKQEFRESKRQAKAAISKPAPKRDELSELKSVDALFASMGDDDDDDGPIRDPDDSDDDSDSSAGAFCEVDGSGDEGPLRTVKKEDLEAEGEEDDGENPVARHAKEMKLIKEKDPEFYEYLLKEDRALLDFSMGDETDVEGLDEEEIAAKAAEKARSEKQLLTAERLERIHSVSKESFTACRAAVNAFHLAVRSIEVQKPKDPFAEEGKEGEEDEEGGRGGKKKRKERNSSGKWRYERGPLRIEDEAVFSSAIEWAVANLLTTFKAHAGEYCDDDKKKKSKKKKAEEQDGKFGKDGPMDPTKYKRWPRLKPITQIFWDETFVLLSHLTDSQMLEYVLRHCSTPEALSWLWPFRYLRQRFIKRCCFLWSQSKSHNVRFLAFLFLRNCGAMVLHQPDNASSASMQLQALLKMVLYSFQDVARAGYSWKSLSRFRFMENCMVELLRLEDVTSYRMGYLCIRQLAKILRDACIATSLGAISSKKKPDQKKKGAKKKKMATEQNANALVTWAFVRSLYLWTKAVGSVPALRPLAYPLSMVILGAIKNKLTNLQQFPFVYHCLLSLNRLGASLEAFVPVSSHLLKATGILNAEMEKAVRKRSAKTAQELKEKKTLDQKVRAPELDVLIRFNETQTSEVLTLETIGSGIAFLFYDHLGLLSQSPSFPEIISPVILHLRKYCKNCRSEPLRRQLRTVVEKAESSAAEVRAKREALTEVPDAKKFLLFDADTGIAKARAEALKRRATEEQTRVEAELREEEKDKDDKDKDKKGKKGKDADKEKPVEEEPKKEPKKKKRKVEKKTPQELATEAVDKAVALGEAPDADEVENMAFSSGEEDE